MQHERLVAAEQARGVDARAEVAGELRRFRVAPEAFHWADYTFRHWCTRPSNRAPAVGARARAYAAPIRFAVFVEEQRVPAEIELDEQDAAVRPTQSLSTSEAPDRHRAGCRDAPHRPAWRVLQRMAHARGIGAAAPGQC